MKAYLEKFLHKTGNWGIPLLIALGSFAFGVSEKGWDHKFINADGKGYYAYLPAFFIYQDLHFDFFESYEKKYYAPGQYTDFRIKLAKGYVDRYYIGTSVLMLPFFLIAHVLTGITGGDADGYSIIYQYMILVSACFYLFLGLFFIYKVLTRKFDRVTSILSVFSIGLATPVLFFSALNPDYSHIYSFFLVGFLIFLFDALFESFGRKKLYLISFVFGLLVIVRPSNGIFLFAIPFIAGDLQNLGNFFKSLKKNIPAVLISILIFSGVIFYQLLIYYLQTDHFLVYSYAEAGFNFLDPHFLDVLFSYKSGLFVYSPILLFSLMGFVYYFRKSFYLGGSLLLFLVLSTYVISSWECWWYGATVWMRPFVDFMTFFSFLTAGAVSLLKFRFRLLHVLVIAMFIIHNFIQINQFKNYIFLWGGMDKEKYWKVFMRTDPIYRGYLWGPPVAVQDTVGMTDSLIVLKELYQSFASNPGKVAVNLSVNTTGTKPGDTIPFLVSFKLFPQSDKLKKNVFHFDLFRKINPEVSGFSYDANLRNLNPQQWNEIQKRITLPVFQPNEQFVFSMINNGKYVFLIKDVKISRIVSNTLTEMQQQ